MQIDIEIVRINSRDDFVVQVIAGEPAPKNSNHQYPKQPEIKVHR
jgi:hypothetical protein